MERKGLFHRLSIVAVRSDCVKGHRADVARCHNVMLARGGELWIPSVRFLANLSRVGGNDGRDDRRIDSAHGLGSS